MSGKEDQAGGLVWRAKDANNYYVARANALENNVTIYSQSAAESPLLPGLPPDHLLEVLGIPRTMDFDF